MFRRLGLYITVACMKRELLRFGLHQVQMGETYCLLLPKLNSLQVGMLSSRLEGLGFDVRRGEPLRARKRGFSVAVSSTGVCRSNHDPADVVAPVVPDLLAAPKEPIDLDVLLGMYYHAKSGLHGAVRFSARVESGSSWLKLRKEGSCGLSPDERLVLAHVMSAGAGRCGVVTDFPTDRGSTIRAGDRLYYRSSIPTSLASALLRTSGETGPRNVYLPADGVITFRQWAPPSRRELLDVALELGEWCSFRPI